MKNIQEHQLRKSICLKLDEFAEIIRKAYGPEITVKSKDNCLFVYSPADDIPYEEICETLESYFDVKITDFHLDICDDETNVWVSY